VLLHVFMNVLGFVSNFLGIKEVISRRSILYVRADLSLFHPATCAPTYVLQLSSRPQVITFRLTSWRKRWPPWFTLSIVHEVTFFAAIRPQLDSRPVTPRNPRDF